MPNRPRVSWIPTAPSITCDQCQRPDALYVVQIITGSKKAIRFCQTCLCAVATELAAVTRRRNETVTRDDFVNTSKGDL
jgi:protein-arginine kinase activator protein McsA